MVVVVFGRTVGKFMLIVGNGAVTTGPEGIVLEFEDPVTKLFWCSRIVCLTSSSVPMLVAASMSP